MYHIYFHQFWLRFHNKTNHGSQRVISLVLCQELISKTESAHNLIASRNTRINLKYVSVEWNRLVCSTCNKLQLGKLLCLVIELAAFKHLLGEHSSSAPGHKLITRESRFIKCLYNLCRDLIKITSNTKENDDKFCKQWSFV